MKHSKLLLAIALSGTLVSISCSNSALSQQNQANNKNSSNQSQNQNSPQTQNQPQSQTTPEEAKRIALADAKAAFDAGKVTIIDTRDASSYNAEHIKGAINIPVAEFEGRYKEIPTNKQIIAYCSWPSEHTSARAVLILKEHGITNAAALLGGTQAWKEAGYPMESSGGNKKNK